MVNSTIRRVWVWAMVSTPFGAIAQTTGGAAGGLPGGLQKPVQVLTTVQTMLLAAGVILVTISLIGCGIAMSFYKKRWEDLQGPVLGGIVIGSAVAVAGWLTS